MNKVFEKIIEELEKLDVKAIKRYKGGTFGDYEGTDYYIKKSDAIEIVKQEAEQYNNDWIPCSERLPDDFMSFEYLTIRKGHTLATITYYCVVNHKWYLSRNSSKEIDVIAWMELPSAERRE